MGILMEGGEVNSGLGNRTELAMASGEFYDTLHAIAINTMETEFGSIVEPVPITLKTLKPLRAQMHVLNGYMLPGNGLLAQPYESDNASTSKSNPIQVQEDAKDTQVRPPPKKKWIKEYFEEEPKCPVSVRVVTSLPVVGPRSNGVVVRPASPVTCATPATAPPAAATATATASVVAVAHYDFAEHSRPRANSHGPPPIPSPPSGGSSGSGSGGSAPRAGTREVHNKLEKNRRAHLKECFEMLKRQLPATPDDKKTSNLSILGSAIRYIQVLRRKERECEHEMERLAREKIAAQQRLAALKREVAVRTTPRPRSVGAMCEEKDREERVNGQLIGIPMSITSSPPRANGTIEASPPRTLNLSTKLRTLPLQITPTTSQVVRTTYGARHNTLTLTTLAPADTAPAPVLQTGQSLENGVTTTLSTALVHPAQLHLPLSQVVSSGGLVVGSAALQLLSTQGALRVLQAPTVHTNGITTGESNRLPRENGIVSPPPSSEGAGGPSVVVSGLAPLVVSQPAAHLLQTHTLTHKMVETQVVKGSVAPLTVSAQYLSATTIMKPVVVVSGAGTPPTTT